MNILLLILKIIGIIFLVLLFLLLCFLLHPIYYKGKGEIEDKTSIHATVWWMFQIIRLEISVEDKNFLCRMRIFGRIFFSNDDAEQTEKEEVFSGTPAEKDTGQKKPSAVAVSSKGQNIPLENTAENTAKKGTQAVFAGLTNGRHIFEKIKAEYKDERNRLAIAHIWKEILYLLRQIKPRDIYANLTFSMGDPAATGQVTGIVSLLPLMYMRDVHVYPDFMADKAYVQGKFLLKGHIRLWHLLSILLRVYQDKNIRRMIYRIRRKKEVIHE